MLTTLLAMAGFALVGAITPGPVNVLALRYGSHGGPARQQLAFLYVLGASTSYAFLVWAMGQGAGQIFQRLPALAIAAQWLCAAYLLWLAWCIVKSVQPAQSAAATQNTADATAPQPLQAFGHGVAVQMLNPKAWLVALSGVGMFVLPQVPGTNSWASLPWFCSISLLACLLGVGCWAVAGRALSRWLQSELHQRRLHYGLAALLVASVLAMLA